MKKLIAIALFVSLQLHGQIFTQSTANGAVTITPKGLQGSTNSASINTNAALGASALSVNTTGYGNTAGGSRSLFANTSGYYNTATGFESLYFNTTGDRNTAAGSGALYKNTAGYHNTAVGHDALYGNTLGYQNTAIGREALVNNTTGIQNTSLGFQTGLGNRTGTKNTFIGYNANALDTNYTNAMALGANAIVNANNKIRIGDSNVSSIEGQVAWSFPSDRRLKENIVYTSRLGLDFINRLQTVSYSYLADKAKTRYDGFIAQDIETVMKELNVPFSGLKKADDGTYSLAYSDFVMPLVNAVKEQQKEIQELTKEVIELRELKKQVEALTKMVHSKQ